MSLINEVKPESANESADVRNQETFDTDSETGRDREKLKVKAGKQNSNMHVKA